jgi:hypothetical protein
LTLTESLAWARVLCPRVSLSGLYNPRGDRQRPHLPSRVLDRGVYDDPKELLLLNPLYAPPESKLRRAARVLTRLEPLANMCFWRRRRAGDGDDPDELDLVELPRLRLSLLEREGRLFSLDQADLSVAPEGYLTTRPEVDRLIQGIPHSLVMTNANGEPQVRTAYLHASIVPCGA